MTTEPQSWLLNGPPNVVCFTVRSIVDGEEPVLMASRDAGDGGWQFLTGMRSTWHKQCLSLWRARSRGSRRCVSLQQCSQAGWLGVRRPMLLGAARPKPSKKKSKAAGTTRPKPAIQLVT